MLRRLGFVVVASVLLFVFWFCLRGNLVFALLVKPLEYVVADDA